VEVIGGILGLAVFIGIGWVLTKMSDGAMTGLNCGVLARDEHKGLP